MLSKEVSPPRVAFPTLWASLSLLLAEEPLATLLRDAEEPIGCATLSRALREVEEDLLWDEPSVTWEFLRAAVLELREAEEDLFWEELPETWELLLEAEPELRDAEEDLFWEELPETWELLREAEPELRDAEEDLFCVELL